MIRLLLAVGYNRTPAGTAVYWPAWTQVKRTVTPTPGTERALSTDQVPTTVTKKC